MVTHCNPTTYNNAFQENIEQQRKHIDLESPYSPEINRSFSGYDEFSYLRSLGLKEAFVTRRALIKEIDPNLYITKKKRTNLQLMRQGQAPYVSDDENSYIVIHHIGQAYDAPFAELTAAEHAQFGNNKRLHNSTGNSWRNDSNKERAFMAERSAYWKKRALGEITVLTKNLPEAKNAVQAPLDKNLIKDIQRSLDALFSECSSDDLAYIASLAQDHLIAKGLKVRTIDEFIIAEKESKNEPIVCPCCGSSNISLYGRYTTSKERRQKYKCIACKKTFSLLRNTLIEGNSFTLFEWMRFIDCLYNGFTIAKTARICGVSEKTAFDIRSLIFFALGILEESVSLSGNIAIDETYIPISYKGNHEQQQDFTMPRKARKRGGENHTRGLSKNLAAIVCAVDDSGVSVAKVADCGAPTAQKLDDALLQHIEVNQAEMLYSDKSAAIRRFALNNNLPIQQSRLLAAPKVGQKNYKTIKQIQRVGAYQERLKKFLKRFNGISSEWLQGYVSLFSWRERNKHRELFEAYAELLRILVKPNSYRTVEQILEEIYTKIGTEPAKVKNPHFQNIKSEEKTKKMYELYAKGMLPQEIADIFKCSPQAVRRRIRNFRAWGLAYKTEKDIAAEEIAEAKRTLSARTMQQYAEEGAFYDKLLSEKESWSGSLESFYEYTKKTYGYSRQTTKNRISTAKRIAQLREDYSTNEEYKYRELQDVFEAVYSRYNEIKRDGPNLPKTELYQKLADEFKYKPIMIAKIIKNMESGGIGQNCGSKSKIPMAHTLNRDRSVFIDYLNWPGTKSDFYKHAEQKYRLSRAEIARIIKFNYIADPQRYSIAQRG